MKGYKLTDKNDRSYGGCQWGENTTHETNGGGELCTEGWLHFYDDPILAVLLNPIHADFNNPHLWECETGDTIKTDRGLKFGTTKLITTKRIDLPVVTDDQRIAFGILCAMEVRQSTAWRQWAQGWLDGTDRTKASADYAANAYAYAYAYAAASAARASADAANAAANAAASASAAADAASAARASAATIAASASAAADAAIAYVAIDLKALAQRAIKEY